MDESQKEQIIKAREAQINAIEKTLDGVKISIEALSDGVDYEKQIKQRLGKYITSADLINKEFKFQDSLDKKGAREAYIEFMTDISGDALENGIYIVCFVTIKNGVICATAGVFTKNITQNQRKKITTIIYETIDEIYSDGIIDFLKKPFQVIIEAINRAIYQWQQSFINNVIGTNNATVNNAIYIADSGQIKTDAFINYGISQSPNPHTNNNTFPFKLIIKDYDLLIPLKNKEIQITNIDSKKCYKSKITTANGEVVFEIPQNERGDFFSVTLINDNDYNKSPYYLSKEVDSKQRITRHITNKILTPNNYQKCPAILYFNKKQQGSAIIGVLKAYKTNNEPITMDNSFESFVDEWQDEVWSIDEKQTLRIQAFLYDFDKNENGDKQESTDKNKTTYYQRNLAEDKKIALQDLDKIQWYYQVLNSDIQVRLNVKQVAKNLQFITEQQGTNIYFNLSMLKPNERKNAKRIRIFAYIGDVDGVMYANTININTNKTTGTKERVERIYCVELKVVQNRFSLLFDGEHLTLYENERLFYHKNKPCIWGARSGKATSDTQMQDRLHIKHITNQYFYYDTAFQKNNQVIKEGIFFVKLDNNPNAISLYIYETQECNKAVGTINNVKFSLENGNINLGDNFLDFMESIKNISTDLAIPLKIMYKKRIIIHIKRVSQTTQSTKAEFSMYIDGNKWEFENSNKNKTSKAYVLERSGPDCITPNLELRIPEGRYSVAWHTSSSSYKNNVLKLYNDYLSQGREILIHSGQYPQNSTGCLLLEEKIGGNNRLVRGISIIKALQNTFNDKNFKQTFGKMPNATNHIMVIVKNEFDKAEKANMSCNNENKHYIDDEGYLHWEIDGVDRIENKIATVLNTDNKTYKKFDIRNVISMNIGQPKINDLKNVAIINFTDITLHRTAADNIISTLHSYSKNNAVGTHFLIDTNGNIYQCASLKQYTWHIGELQSKCYNEKTCSKQDRKVIYDIVVDKSITNNQRKVKIDSIEKNKPYSDRYPLNQESIGIEVVGDAKSGIYEPPNDLQKDATLNLVKILQNVFNISKNHIYAHGMTGAKNKTEAVELWKYIIKELE
ncbi:DUF5675 family protein [Helicobacter sp. T3_23-1056]